MGADIHFHIAARQSIDENVSSDSHLPHVPLRLLSATHDNGAGTSTTASDVAAVIVTEAG